jgi:D-alanyl-D-alanine carboxypeptidase/D-alanyl-D-alanine-endopeptidase (penicillin-binding protein 4)
LLVALLGLSASQITSGQAQGLTTEARDILGSDQGVYVEATDGTVLLAQLADRPVHPASVSKVPTTLALLRKFGPEHRFTTVFATNGRILDGTLHGDLLVQGDGDPAFVDENACLVAQQLSGLGIQRINGRLRPRGPLTFDWQADEDGVHLRRALSGLISRQALATVRALALENAREPITDSTGWHAPQPENSPTPRAIQFVSDTQWGHGETTQRTLLIHKSQPLLSLAKSLNDYSNNIFRLLAQEAGGAAAVEAVGRSVLPEAMRGEITLGDGAGADPTNRLSPRAAVRLLRALEEELETTNHHLVDILPVAGIDEGTLHDRLNAPGEAGHIVGKTGTYGDYGASALVGAISTADHGTVYFAILNHGVPVPEARRRQDRFVRALLGHLHSLPWAYQRDTRPAIARAEVVVSVSQ